MSEDNKTKFLYDWKLKLGILAAILMPAVTATGSFYKMEIRLNEKTFQTENRISKLELDSERNFASKTTIEQMTKEMKDMRTDLTEIKTLLKNKLR